jgi:hypothetical protein
MAPPPTPVGRPEQQANLLDIVPATLAVSSTVDNPRDFPEHLIDGKADTAWNSKTGDLRGFIAFRVPKDAQVDIIQLTAGFTKIGAKQDLFTANHRIKRVAIFRDDVLVKEADLDITVRALQSISIGGPGGDYRIEVKDTEPGTNKAWKELVVSEFRVVGKPGAEKRDPSDPLVVALRTLDQADGAPLGIETSLDIPAAKSIAALCAAWIPKQAEVAKSVASGFGLKVGIPSCVEVPAPVPFTPAAPYKSVRALKLNDGLRSGTDLVVETARGFFLLNAMYQEIDPTDPGCPSIVRMESIEELRVENGHLLVVAAATRGSYVDPAPPDEDGYRYALVRMALWAKDDGKTFVTRLWNPQFHGGLGEKIQPFGPLKYVNGAQVPVPSRPWSSIPWKDLVNFRITPNGTLQRLP